GRRARSGQLSVVPALENGGAAIPAEDGDGRRVDREPPRQRPRRVDPLKRDGRDAGLDAGLDALDAVPGRSTGSQPATPPRAEALRWTAACRRGACKMYERLYKSISPVTFRR
ncbi:MAG: hypothetical protein ACXV3A_05085, partial [Kineosporiaceae bacterium]